MDVATRGVAAAEKPPYSGSISLQGGGHVGEDVSIEVPPSEQLPFWGGPEDSISQQGGDNVGDDVCFDVPGS